MACSSFEGDGKNGAYCDMAEDTCPEHPECRLAADGPWKEIAETAQADAGLPRRALLDERPSIQLVERELKLGTGIHHDRPVPRDGLLYRLS